MEKIQVTLLEMLEDRGYRDFLVSEVLDGKGKKCSFRDSDLVVVAEKNDSKLFVFFNNEDKLYINSMRRYQWVMKDKKVKDSIIIHVGDITPAAFSLFTDNMQHFHEKELTRNITHHELYSKHVRLTNPEIEELTRSIEFKHLPSIQMVDSIVKYHGWKEGDVIRIRRNIYTATKKNLFFFRKVVK